MLHYNYLLRHTDMTRYLQHGTLTAPCQSLVYQQRDGNYRYAQRHLQHQLALGWVRGRTEFCPLAWRGCISREQLIQHITTPTTKLTRVYIQTYRYTHI